MCFFNTSLKLSVEYWSCSTITLSLYIVMYCSDIGAPLMAKSALDFSQIFGHAKGAEVAKVIMNALWNGGFQLHLNQFISLRSDGPNWMKNLHQTCRWLTLIPAAVLVIARWEAVHKYFLEDLRHIARKSKPVISMRSNNKYIRICAKLKDPVLLVQLHSSKFGAAVSYCREKKILSIYYMTSHLNLSA